MKIIQEENPKPKLKRPHKFHLSPQQLQQKKEGLEARLRDERMTPNRFKRIKAQLKEVGKAMEDPSLVVDPEKERLRRERDQQRRVQKKLKRKQQIIKQIKKQKKQAKRCFNCNQYHLLSQCTLVPVNICFRCGSNQHFLHQCKLQGPLKFAECFVCKMRGHLSKECPANENGMYRYGGGCFRCGGKDHVQARCPQRLGTAVMQQEQQF